MAKDAKNAKTYFISGVNPILTLLERYPERIIKLTMAENNKPSERVQRVIGLAQQFNITYELIDQLSFKQQHQGVSQGVAAEVLIPKTLHDKELKNWLKSSQKKDKLLLILDQIQDPHNLGAILRTADGAGVDAVIISDKNTVPLNATVSKVASGAAEFVRLFRVTNLNRTIDLLKDSGVWIVGTTDHAPSSIYQTQLNGSLALIMGSESTGMRRLTEQACDFLVSVPMSGVVNSLNVSVATGICLYEILRQKEID